MGCSHLPRTISQLRQLKSGARKTLYDQFNHVRAETPYTHVNIYGDLSIGQSQLRDFLAYKHEPKFKINDTNENNGPATNSNSKLGLATPNQHSFDLNDNVNVHSHSNYYDQLLNTEEKNIALQVCAMRGFSQVYVLYIPNLSFLIFFSSRLQRNSLL